MPRAELAWLGRYALAMAFVLGANLSRAQAPTDFQRAPTLTIERFLEDWSYLADPKLRTGQWTERFRYIPLSKRGWTYLTTGLEARARYESFENLNWGSAADDDYVWLRLMPHGDLHVGKARLFVQPILSAIAGTDRAPSPIDTTGVDLLQAFIELDLTLTDALSLQVSGGRKLVALGAGRLIDTRYGPNVPQPFDGVQLTLQGGLGRVTALYLRPVDTKAGHFDDRASGSQAVWGIYATHWLSAGNNGIDVFYLGFLNRHAIFDQGAGGQTVHSFGSRVFGNTEAWRWNFEGVLQSGRFAGDRIDAWGAGGEVAYRFRDLPLQPEPALMLDVISGDRDPHDDRLGTFTPMFPRGKYFAAGTPIGPRNLIHLQPSAALYPLPALAISLTAIAYWRESTRDGIYAIPGILVRSGKDSRERFIGYHLELAAAWQATPELNLSASVGAFSPGPFIRDTGPARTMKVAAGMANFRF